MALCLGGGLLAKYMLSDANGHVTTIFRPIIVFSVGADYVPRGWVSVPGAYPTWWNCAETFPGFVGYVTEAEFSASMVRSGQVLLENG